MPEQPGGRPARPGTVSFASFMLYLLALICLILAGLGVYASTFATHDALVRIYTDAGYPKDQVDTIAKFEPIGAYGSAGVLVVLAILFLLLGVFVGKGKQWARITTWIVAGLFACCCGVGSISSAASSSMFSGVGSQNGIDAKKAAEDIAALTPSWIQPVDVTLGVIGIVCSLIAIILLALPPSHPFFRKAEPVWTPPTYPNA